jgi:hypothetical protein
MTAVFGPAHLDRFGGDDRLVLVEVFDVGGDAAFVLEPVGLAVALVDEVDLDAAVEERKLSQPLRQRVEGEDGGLEDGEVGLERDLGAATVGRTHFEHLGHGDPAFVALGEGLAFAPDRQVEPLREGVDYGHTDPVQTTRDLVGLLFELAAGVQFGEHHLGGVAQARGMGPGGNAAAVVDDGDRVVDVDEDFDGVAVPGEGLVDGVVDDLVDQMMEARLAGGADVHRGTDTHRLKSFEDLDGVCAVSDLVGFFDHGCELVFRSLGGRGGAMDPAAVKNSARRISLMGSRLPPMPLWGVSFAPAFP